MSEQSSQPHARPKLRLLLIGAIVLGLALTAFFGVRAVSSFRQLQYIRQQGLDRGNGSVDAIRPWMTLRFVAVAYVVPEEYLYSQLPIPFDQRRDNTPLGELNRAYGLGPSSNGTSLVILDRVKAAITAYRANPVVTGLRDVRPWMSIRYISTSTGVPTDYIFTQIGLPSSGNEYKPLDLLSDQQHYKGGPRALVESIQRALAAHPR